MKLSDYEKEHLAAVREGLSECMVLLKKNGAFPLKRAGTLAAYGNGIRNSVKGGTGSGEVNSRYFVNIEQGLREAGFTLLTEEWLDGYEKERVKAIKAYRRQMKAEAKAAGTNMLIYAMGKTMPEPDYDLPLRFDADAAVYVLSRISGEGNDRKAVPGDVFLSDTEIRDILALDKKYGNFMLVVNAGGPVDLTPVRNVGNILVLSQLGVDMGSVLADVLLGKAYPSGKLTATWAAWEDYCPDLAFGERDDTCYREGIYVGYRYFDTVGKRALFPFGYGLSYTEFSMEDVQVSLEKTCVKLQAKVTNTGAYPGKEVLQVYVTAPEKKLSKPWQELAAFGKTGEMRPGESEILEIAFELSELASFDEERCAYVLEAGAYVLRVGSDSIHTEAAAVLALDQDVIVKQVRSVVEQADFKECVYERAVKEEDLTGVSVYPVKAEWFQTVTVTYGAEPEVAPEVAALSEEELSYLAVGSFPKKGGLASVIGSAASHVAGAAGESTSELAAKGFPSLVMADGPAGLRLAKEFYEDQDGAHGVGSSTMPESMLELMSGPLKWIAKLFLGGKKPPKTAEIRNQYCTAIPIGTAIAQSWNLKFAEVCGDIVGSEMEQFGVHLWLAPALNIHRSILCGRNFEYFSEDPLISGKFAAAITKGVQKHEGRGTTIKHFAANNQEFYRYNNNSVVSERALREIYLRGFGICVREAAPCAVMTSYNLLNGVHTAESRGLIEDYLRRENGYEGIVMTDWIIAQMTPKNSKYRGTLSDQAAAAGNDLFMPGCMQDCENIRKALKDGRLSREQLEVSGTRVYRMAERLAGGK